MKDKKTEIKPPEEKYAERFYGLFKSNQRKELHEKIFGAPTDQTKWKDLMVEENKKILSRLLTICNEINNRKSIISTEVYHWTSQSNLMSIIEKGYFFGSEVMNRRQVEFQKNVLNEADIARGDANVICFCPFLVDVSAIISEQIPPKIRENMVRLKIDLTQVNLIGKYNQFVKMYDFGSPNYRADVKVNEEFSFLIVKMGSSMQVSFHCGEQKGSAEIIAPETDDKKEKDASKSIFYGDINSVNWFFATKIIDLINQNAPEFRQAFYNYLDTLSDEEITKIFVVMGQWLTLYSEYNFYSSLPLTPDLVTEIYDVDSNQTFSKPKLQQLKLPEKNATHPNGIIKCNSERVTITQYGHEIQIFLHENKKVRLDLSNLPAERFSSRIDTRDFTQLAQITNSQVPKFS